MFRLWRSIAASAIVAAICLVAPVFAAVSTTPVFVQTPQLEGANFSANPGTYKIIYTGGTNGSKITGVICISTDTTASHLVQVYVNSVSASVLCSATIADCTSGAGVTVAISSGTATGAPATNMLSQVNWPGLPLDSDGNPYIYLTSSQSLQATFATALGAGAISCVAIGADF